MSMQASPPWH